jgi:hypothetical protein
LAERQYDQVDPDNRLVAATSALRGACFLDAAASAHQRGGSPGCDMPADCAPLSRLERVPEPLDVHRA